MFIEITHPSFHYLISLQVTLPHVELSFTSLHVPSNVDRCFDPISKNNCSYHLSMHLCNLIAPVWLIPVIYNLTNATYFISRDVFILK